MKVALGAARGLAFLHNAKNQVIYRDFKTSNVLLDSVCEVWFFGLSFRFLYLLLIHLLFFLSHRTTMPSFLTLDWQKMDQLVTKAMCLQGSWEHMGMRHLNILQQVSSVASLCNLLIMLFSSHNIICINVADYLKINLKIMNLFHVTR